jgi:hypothetical protein
MDSVVRVWCEYDLGEVTSSHVYTELYLAREAAFHELFEMGIAESLEELEDQGLIGFEWFDVITERGKGE